MKALILLRAGELSLKDVLLPERKPDEARIRAHLAGICRTDLELYGGYMDFSGILGHEFVGVVEEADEPRWVGKRVVGEINLPCGSCETCLAGLGRHCPNRRVLGMLEKDGVFAEYLTLPLANLHEVPSGVSDRQAVFTEPLAAAWEICEQLHILPTDRVVVFGDGKLGLLVAMVMRSLGVELTVVGCHEHKLDIVRQLGVETVFADRLDRDRRFDVVVEATGRKEGLEGSLAHLRPQGTLVLKSTLAEDSALPVTPLVVNEINITGSRCGPFEPALRSLAEGVIDPEPLISAVFPLSEGIEAFRKASEHGVLKVLLELPGD